MHRVTTTEVNDMRAGESPGAPVIVRNDPFLEIALGLASVEGRDVQRVDV